MNKQQIAKSSQYRESLLTSASKAGPVLLIQKKKKQYLKFVLKPEYNYFLMISMQKKKCYFANSVSIGLTFLELTQRLHQIKDPFGKKVFQQVISNETRKSHLC